MRGFVITISTLLIFSVTLAFILFLYHENLRAEGALTRLMSTPAPSFVFDDVATDLSSIFNHNITAGRSNATLSILLQGSFANPPGMGDLAAYSSFLATTYSNLTNSNLSLDAGGLADGSAEVLFSNGLLFSYIYTGASKSALLSSSSTDTNASAYEVNVSVDRNRQSYTPWSSSPGGELNVTLRITDRSGNLTSIVSLNRSATNSYIVAYQGGSLVVRAGKIGLTDGALEVNPSGGIVESTHYSAAASLPPGNLSSSLRYYWNAWLNYSRPGNISRSDWVEIGKA